MQAYQFLYLLLALLGLVLIVPHLRRWAQTLAAPPPVLRLRAFGTAVPHISLLVVGYLVVAAALGVDWILSQMATAPTSAAPSGFSETLTAVPVALPMILAAVAVMRALCLTSNAQLIDSVMDTAVVLVAPLAIAVIVVTPLKVDGGSSHTQTNQMQSADEAIASMGTACRLGDATAVARNTYFRHPALLDALAITIVGCLLVEMGLCALGAKAVRWPVPVNLGRQMMAQKEQVDEYAFGPSAVRSLYAAVLEAHRGNIRHVLWLSRSVSDEVSDAIMAAANGGTVVQILVDPASEWRADQLVQRLRNAGVTALYRLGHIGDHHFLAVVTRDGRVEAATACPCPLTTLDDPDDPSWGFRTRSHLLCRDVVSHFCSLWAKMA